MWAAPEAEDDFVRSAHTTSNAHRCCVLLRADSSLANPCVPVPLERPPATPPKKFPYLRKTPRKIQINYPLPYKERLKSIQSTVMQSVRDSIRLHSQRVAEARAAAGEEVCEAFDNMVDGVVAVAEVERRQQMGEISQELASNSASQAQLRQRGAEEIVRRRTTGTGSMIEGENSDDEYTSDGGTVYAEGAAAREARDKAIAEGKLKGHHPASSRGARGVDGLDRAEISRHTQDEMAKLLRDESGMLADLERLKQLEAVETEQACQDAVEWIIRCLEAERIAAAEEAARLAREAAEAAEREARAHRNAELEARLANLEEQVAVQTEMENALKQKQVVENIARGDTAMIGQQFADAVRHYDSALEIDAGHEEALRKRAVAAAAASGDLSLLSEADRAAVEQVVREKSKKEKKPKRAKEEEVRRAREEAIMARKLAAEERKSKREQATAGRGGRGGRGESGTGNPRQGGALIPPGMPGYKPLSLVELRKRFAEVGNANGEIGPDEIEAAIEHHTLADWYHHLVDYDPGGSMLEHFRKFDTDGDGTVSFAEFCAGFGVDVNAATARTPTPEGTPSAKELYELFCYIDKDGNKTVDGQEVAVAIENGALLDWYAFMVDFMPGSSVYDYFDKNGCVCCHASANALHSTNRTEYAAVFQKVLLTLARVSLSVQRFGCRVPRVRARLWKTGPARLES